MPGKSRMIPTTFSTDSRKLQAGFLAEDMREPRPVAPARGRSTEHSFAAKLIENRFHVLFRGGFPASEFRKRFLKIDPFVVVKATKACMLALDVQRRTDELDLGSLRPTSGTLKHE
jgi:hypothetical protein